MQWWLRAAGGQRFKGGCIWWANLRKVFDILHLRSGMSVKAIFWEVRHVKCFSIKSVTDLIFTFHLPPVWSRYIVFRNEFVASAYWLMIHSTTNDVIKIRRYSWSSALQRIANSGRLKPNSQRKTELNSTELNSTGSFSSVRLSSVSPLSIGLYVINLRNWTQPNWTERSSWVQFSRVQFSAVNWA